MAGAVVMLEPSMYPAAPETIHPTANPTMILVFLRKGDPKISVRTILMKDRNPMPMNSAEPHGRGLGAKMVGQSSNIPLVAVAQPFEPPAQLGAPEDPISDAPIRRTTIPNENARQSNKSGLRKCYIHEPVIIGGNNLLRVLGGANARPISKREHMIEVPDK